MDEEARPENDKPVASDRPDESEAVVAVPGSGSESAELELALAEDPFAETEEQGLKEPEPEAPSEESAESAAPQFSAPGDTVPAPVASDAAAAPESAADAGVVDEPAATETEAPEVTLDEMVASLREDEVPDETGEAAEPSTETEEAGESEPFQGAVASEEEMSPAAAASTAVLAVVDENSSRARRSRSARVPFHVYLGAWLVFSGVTAYLLWPIGSGLVIDDPTYGLLVLVGVALVCSGPLVALGSWWYASAHSEPDQRVGLVRAVLLRSAGALAGGVVLWWLALIVLDLQRTGLLG